MNQPRIQITLIQIDNYGPWTTTLGNDREHQLQILQAELYASLQRNFSVRNALVFFNKFDEMYAITNGISKDEHLKIREQALSTFPFTVSMSIGVGSSPYEAQAQASRMLQATGSAQSEKRKMVLVGDHSLTLDESYAQIIHIDVDGITKLIDHDDSFETSQKLVHTHAQLMELFSQHNSLLFYMGGDNFMGAIGQHDENAILRGLEGIHINGLALKYGIGRAATARKAAELATMNLEQVRHQRKHLVSPLTRERR
ncbi:MAG TPA: GTP cyclohydrolase IIa [Candidatus Bathyarchaeia archaeon]|nr:GTP cyclohydrolase IIa [Candidatus Bathyarchaeia archaeon]